MQRRNMYTDASELLDHLEEIDSDVIIRLKNMVRK